MKPVSAYRQQHFPSGHTKLENHLPDAIETRNRLGEHKRLYEEVLPKKRCLTDVLIREFSVRDVLGLCQFSWQTGQKVRCQALPQLDAIKQLPCCAL